MAESGERFKGRQHSREQQRQQAAAEGEAPAAGESTSIGLLGFFFLVLAVLSALLAAHIAPPHKVEMNFLALSMWLWGGMLYIWMMSLIFAFGMMWAWLIFPIPIYGTLWILLIAFVTIALPAAYQQLQSAFRAVNPSAIRRDRHDSIVRVDTSSSRIGPKTGRRCTRTADS